MHSHAQDLLFIPTARSTLIPCKGAHILAVAGSDRVRQPHLTLGRKTGSPVDTEKYIKPKVSFMILANNGSLGDVVFVCCIFF